MKKNNTKIGFIEKFGLFFAKNYRITILFIIGVLLLGFLSYTSFLKREGFPSINFPIAIININYRAESPNVLDEQVIKVIENEAKAIPEIENINSTNFGTGGTIVLTFQTDLEDTKPITNQLEQNIKNNSLIPQEANINFVDVNVSAENGVDDIVLNLVFEDKQNQNLTNERLIELQEKAVLVSNELSKVNGVQSTRVINSIETRNNPQNGQEIKVQESFNRVTIKENGEFKSYDAIAIGIAKESSASIVHLSSELRQKIDTLENNNFLNEYKIITGSDPSEIINQQISSLESNVIMGLLIVALLLFFVIGWRSSIIIVVFIPLVLGLAFLSFFVIGYSLNVITLFGLILVLGIIADDAIVVLEAIEYYKNQGYYGYEAVKIALKDIGVSDIAGTVTTVLVFIPMAFISGILGEFIRAIPVTVIITLISSLFIGLSIVVFLSNLLFKTKSHVNKTTFTKFFNFFPWVFDGLSTLVYKIVSLYLRFKGVSLIISILTIVLISLSVSYFSSKVPFDLFPQPKDGNRIDVSIRLPENATLDETKALTQEIENTISAKYGEYIQKIDYLSGNRNSSEFELSLIDYSQREITSPQIRAGIQEELNKLNIPTNTTISVQSIGGGGPPPSEFQASIKVINDDQEVLQNATENISNFVQTLDLNGIKIERTRINNVFVITKENGVRSASVQVGYSEGYDSNTTNLLEEKLNEFYTIERLQELGLNEDELQIDLGQAGDFGDSFNSAIVAFIAAIILMYSFLVGLYKSFLQPLLIFIAVPFTLPGVYGGLYLTQNAFSFFVFIGFIALFGVVVNNSILLISYANNLRQKGMSLKEAISEAVKVRTKPILATTLTTLGGLIPLALTDPFWEALAYTIIFGLFSSLIFIIISFPAFYMVFEKIRSVKTKAAIKIKNFFQIEI
jgi:HAE1 family hydrophobic/amphiphilic exporter-1